jgi:hypothetical protein
MAVFTAATVYAGRGLRRPSAATVTTIIDKITTNTVEIASIRIHALALQFSVEIARLGEHVIARADRRAAHQVGGDRVSDALSQVEAVGDDGL